MKLLHAAEALGIDVEFHTDGAETLQVLAALVTYQQGHGMRGKGEWTVAPQVVDALNAAYRAAFENIVPCGKRLYLGLDVSGSMSGGSIAAIPGLTPRLGSAALAMLSQETEKGVIIKGFQDRLLPLKVRPG